MAKRGPKEKPVALKAFLGNPGKRPLNDEEPKFPAGIPQPPDWLLGTARAKWDERIVVLSKVPGLLTAGDGDSLALYCEAWAEMQAAQEMIDAQGLISVSEKGGEYQNPAVGIKNRAIARLKQFGALFGMSPADRAALKIPADARQGKLSKYIS